jgi:hypothetical protein
MTGRGNQSKISIDILTVIKMKPIIILILLTGCVLFDVAYQEEVAEDTLETLIKDEFEGVSPRR